MDLSHSEGDIVICVSNPLLEFNRQPQLLSHFARAFIEIQGMWWCGVRWRTHWHTSDGRPLPTRMDHYIIFRRFEHRRRSEIRDALHGPSSKIRWSGHVKRFADARCMRAVTRWISLDAKRTPERPTTSSSDFFVKAPDERLTLGLHQIAQRYHLNRMWCKHADPRFCK